jgi:hypothetical protein
MLLNESEQVRECVRHAEECAGQAKAQTNPKFQQDFLDLERRWLRLARSYERSSGSSSHQQGWRNTGASWQSRIAGSIVIFIEPTRDSIQTVVDEQLPTRSPQSH